MLSAVLGSATFDGAVAAAGCALTAWLLVPAGAHGLIQGRLLEGTTRRPRWPPHRLAGRRAVVVGLLVMVLAGASLRPAPTALPLAASATFIVITGSWLLRRSRARKQASARRALVIEGCDALAAGLRAGQPPQHVLDRVAADVTALAPAAAAARLGGNVTSALRTSASTEGAEGLALLAAAWTVAQRSGAGLADVVARIAGSVRADAEQRRQIDVALATSRSTARLLAGLPLMGVLLGTGIDADPVGVLLGSVVGAWCLFIGVSLAICGVLWVERLADRATR